MKGIPASVAVVMVTICLCTSNVSNHYGREFIVVFMEHVIDRSVLEFFLSTESTSTVNVDISAPLEPSTQPTLIETVTQGQTTRVTLERTINLKYTNVFDRGILVQSEGDICVQAFSLSTRSTFKSVGAHLAFPVSSFATDYIVIAYCEANSCQIGVVSSADGTFVNIDLKIAGTDNVRLFNVDYYNGDTITLTLNKYQALEIQSSDDLSGTRVRASEPIGVFVGTDYTTVGSGTSGDMITEQLLPNDVWGMDYYLAPFPGRNSGDVIKVVAEFADTTVTFLGTDHVIPDAGGSLKLTLPSSTPVMLTSDKRIGVAQITQSPVSGETSSTDPTMLLVAPIEQWLDKYIFTAPVLTSIFDSVQMTILTYVACKSEIYLDNTKQTLTWSDVDSDVTVAYVTLADSAHELQVTSACGSVWGYLYGTAADKAWSMPIGWNLKTLPEMKTTTTSTTTSTTTTATTTTTTVTTTTTPTTTTTTTPTTTTTTPTTTTTTPTTTPTPTTTITTTTTTTTPTTPPTTTTPSTTTTPTTTTTTTTSTTTTTTSTTTTPPTTSTASTTSSSTSASTSTSSTSTTTAQSTTTLTTTTSLQTTTPRKLLCTCKCSTLTTETQIIAIIEEIKTNLTVDTPTLSATVRKHTSAVDNRTSAVALGSLGIAMISVVVVFLTGPDVINVIAYLCQRGNRS